MTTRTLSPASAAPDELDRAAAYLADRLGGTVIDPERERAGRAAAAKMLAGWNRSAYARAAEVTAVWVPGATFPACRARWLLTALDAGQAVSWMAAYPRRRRDPWRPATAPTREQLAAWAEPCPVLPWWWAPPGPAHPGGVCDCAERAARPAPRSAPGPAPVPPPVHPETAGWTVLGHTLDLSDRVLRIDGRQVADDVSPADIVIYARRLYVGGRPVANLAA